ncbi:TetR/AcrR family transcriptional regulator [Chondromyces crocatus]|uniref:Transcriptional regulator n=1 Tax=Chondromyces crocatus TaxID=52 RepID=A0A0K1ENP5_CHOCO|nr:TetR/AcrR family transcriptional regulator [Chondromyces crocatus]AKT42466.1 transcriptional regulator [Chondromyces crocatus]
MARGRTTELRRTPKQDRSRETVNVILQATTYILIREGYAALTTNRVAERAGVNIASLYQFFPNKEALVVELERRHVARTDAVMGEVLRKHTGKGGKARLRTLVKAFMAAQAVEPALQRVFAEEMPRIRSRRPPTAGERCAAQAGAFFASLGVALPNPELSGWLLATVCHAVILQGFVERQDDVLSGVLEDELVLLLERYLGLPEQARLSEQARPRRRRAVSALAEV